MGQVVPWYLGGAGLGEGEVMTQVCVQETEVADGEGTARHRVG